MRVRLLAVPGRQRARRLLVGLHQPSDAIAIRLKFFLRHSDPAVAHPQGQEDFIAHVLLVGPAVEPPNDFAEDEPTRVGVIAGGLPDNPVLLQRRITEPRNDLVPRSLRPAGLAETKAAGVREAGTQGDRLFA